MSETLDYIESYFEKKLSAAEKQRFEERIAQDETFAGEVAFYISLREAIRQKLAEQKKLDWQDGQQSIPAAAPVKKISVRSWLPYAAAACLLLAIALYLFLPSETPQRLAGTYITQHLTHLSQTMDGSKDSLQEGIGAYNRGDYNRALLLFQGVYQSHPDNSDAKQYIGLVYLMQNDYDNALQHFDELAAKKLFSNPGPFLKAVTLLKRNKSGDKELAKTLLEHVRDQQLEGRAEAAEWLKRW